MPLKHFASAALALACIASCGVDDGLVVVIDTPSVPAEAPAVVDCDDGNPCTTDVVRDGACVHENATDRAPCSDGSACSLPGLCFAGECVEERVVCDDGVPCTVDSCDDVTGCTHVPVHSLCNDGDACSLNTCDATDGCILELRESGELCDAGPCALATCSPDGECIPFVDDDGRCPFVEVKPKVVASHNLEKACVLFDDATVRCSGFNDSYDSRVFNFVDVAIRFGQICGIGHDGVVSCIQGWEHRRPELGRFREFIDQEQQFCAITLDGELQCWAPVGAVDQSDPTPHRLLPQGPLVDLALDFIAACFIKADGEVGCQLDEEYRQEYIDDLVELLDPPEYEGRAVDVATSSHNSACLITDRGRVHCWGRRPIVVSDGLAEKRFTSIRGQASSFCGITDEQQTVCWSSYDGGDSEYLLPDDLVDVAVDVHLADGGTGGCVLSSENHVVCWNRGIQFEHQF